MVGPRSPWTMRDTRLSPEEFDYHAVGDELHAKLAIDCRLAG